MSPSNEDFKIQQKLSEMTAKLEDAQMFLKQARQELMRAMIITQEEFGEKVTQEAKELRS